MTPEQAAAQPSPSYAKQRDDWVGAMINGAWPEIRDSRQIARTALAKAYDAGYNHGYLNGFDHPQDAAEAEQRRQAAEIGMLPCVLCGRPRHQHYQSGHPYGVGHPFMEA